MNNDPTIILRPVLCDLLAGELHLLRIIAVVVHYGGGV